MLSVPNRCGVHTGLGWVSFSVWCGLMHSVPRPEGGAVKPPPRSSLNPKKARRTYLLGILQGLFAQLGMNVSHPSLVLSVLVRELGGSNTLVGFLPAIRFGVFSLPQFLVAGWLETQHHRARVVVAGDIARLAAYGAMAAIISAGGVSRPTVTLAVFLLLFAFSRLAGGVGALARMDVIAQAVAPARRASFFANRSLWGGLAAFGVGFLVSYVLDPANGHPYPYSYVLLLVLSMCSFLAAAIVFSRITDMPGNGNVLRHSLMSQLARAPSLLMGDPFLRRYLIVRVLLTMTRLAEPFYPVFALDVLGAPTSMVGYYLSASTLARILSNLLWQTIDRSRGTLFLLKLSGWLTVLAPLMAALVPWVMRAVGFTVENSGLLPAYLFGLVFLVAGGSNSGRMIGLSAMLLNIAPDDQRPSFIGLVSTVLGFVNFLPILAGAIVDSVGFAPVFFTATCLILLANVLLMSWRDSGTRG